MSKRIPQKQSQELVLLNKWVPDTTRAGLIRRVEKGNAFYDVMENAPQELHYVTGDGTVLGKVLPFYETGILKWMAMAYVANNQPSWPGITDDIDEAKTIIEAAVKSS